MIYTHHKCGTNYIGSIIHQMHVDHGVQIPWDSNACYQKILHERKSQPGLHIIRDPRDIVLSSYHSHINDEAYNGIKGHPLTNWPELQAHRLKLQNVSLEEGLYMDMMFIESPNWMTTTLPYRKRVQPPMIQILTWDYDNPYIETLRMEDWVDNTHEYLKRECDEKHHKVLEKVIESNSFETLQSQRPHHYRDKKKYKWKTELPQSIIDLCNLRYYHVIRRFYNNI